MNLPASSHQICKKETTPDDTFQTDPNSFSPDRLSEKPNLKQPLKKHRI